MFEVTTFWTLSLLWDEEKERKCCNVSVRMEGRIVLTDALRENYIECGLESIFLFIFVCSFFLFLHSKHTYWLRDKKKKKKKKKVMSLFHVSRMYDFQVKFMIY